jgi:hypothetical protein
MLGQAGDGSEPARVIARTKAKAYADQVKAHLKDSNNAVAEAAALLPTKHWTE